jgi:hypothetical protein
MKGLSNQRSWGRMVPTDASVDLQEEHLALLDQDAFHQHSHRLWAALVKLSIDDDIYLGALGNSPRLGSISWADLIVVEPT